MERLVDAVIEAPDEVGYVISVMVRVMPYSFRRRTSQVGNTSARRVVIVSSPPTLGERLPVRPVRRRRLQVVRRARVARPDLSGVVGAVLLETRSGSPTLVGSRELAPLGMRAENDAV